MCKKFIVNVHRYPHEYTIEADNEDEAREIAKAKFFNDTDGASVYDTEVYEDGDQDEEEPE